MRQAASVATGIAMNPHHTPFGHSSQGSAASQRKARQTIPKNTRLAFRRPNLTTSVRLPVAMSAA